MTESSSGEPAAGRGSIRSAPASAEKRIGPGRIWGMASTAAVAAGLISWLGGEMVQDTFQPQQFPTVVPGGATEMRATTASTNVAEFKNATFAFAILGGVTGLAMGFAGGLAGRSLSRGVAVGLGGHVAGMFVGAAASLGLLRFFYRGYVVNPNDLMSPILIHGGIWMAIGAVGGSAFALGMGRWRRIQAAIGGAALGGFFASIFYQAFSASFFPDAHSSGPLASHAPVRLLAMLSATVLIAAGAARGTQGHRASAKPAPPGPDL